MSTIGTKLVISKELKNFCYDDQGQKSLNWRNVKVLSVDESAPFVIQFKDNYEDDYKFVNTLKTRGIALRKQKRTYQMPKKLSSAYSNVLPITYKKWEDLMSLCKKGVINGEYHSYYRNVPHDDEL